MNENVSECHPRPWHRSRRYILGGTCVFLLQAPRNHTRSPLSVRFCLLVPKGMVPCVLELIIRCDVCPWRSADLRIRGRTEKKLDNIMFTSVFQVRDCGARSAGEAPHQTKTSPAIGADLLCDDGRRRCSLLLELRDRCVRHSRGRASCRRRCCSRHCCIENGG